MTNSYISYQNDTNYCSFFAFVSLTKFSYCINALSQKNTSSLSFRIQLHKCRELIIVLEEFDQCGSCCNSKH